MDCTEFLKNIIETLCNSLGTTLGVGFIWKMSEEKSRTTQPNKFKTSTNISTCTIKHAFVPYRPKILIKYILPVYEH